MLHKVGWADSWLISAQGSAHATLGSTRTTLAYRLFLMRSTHYLFNQTKLWHLFVIWFWTSFMRQIVKHLQTTDTIWYYHLQTSSDLSDLVKLMKIMITVGFAITEVCWQGPAMFWLKQTFPPIIWIFTEGDGIESRLHFIIFSTLPT